MAGRGQPSGLTQFVEQTQESQEHDIFHQVHENYYLFHDNYDQEHDIYYGMHEIV